jgi:hypothetical protein
LRLSTDASPSRQIVRLLHRQKALIMVLKTIFLGWKPLMWHSVFCYFCTIPPSQFQNLNPVQGLGVQLTTRFSL